MSSDAVIFFMLIVRFCFLRFTLLCKALYYLNLTFGIFFSRLFRWVLEAFVVFAMVVLLVSSASEIGKRKKREDWVVLLFL
jgi:large-conductance mechanosensitive channel